MREGYNPPSCWTKSLIKKILYLTVQYNKKHHQ